MTSSRPTTTRISGHRSTRRSRRSTGTKPTLTRSAKTPIRIRIAGQNRLLYPRRVPIKGAPYRSGARSPDDEPQAQDDQRQRPDQVPTQPGQKMQVAQEQIDPERDQDGRPEVLATPEIHGADSDMSLRRARPARTAPAVPWLPPRSAPGRQRSSRHGGLPPGTSQRPA